MGSPIQDHQGVPTEPIFIQIIRMVFSFHLSQHMVSRYLTKEPSTYYIITRGEGEGQPKIAKHYGRRSAKILRNIFLTSERSFDGRFLFVRFWLFIFLRFSCALLCLSAVPFISHSVITSEIFFFMLNPLYIRSILWNVKT